MNTRALGIGILFVSLLSCGTCLAADAAPETQPPKNDEAAQKPEPPKAEEAAQKPEQGKVAAVEQFKKAGAVSCTDETATILNFLYEDGTYAYLNKWNNEAPDKHSTMTLLAKDFSDGTALASVTTSRTAGGCDVSFTQVIASADTCTKLRETVFKDWVYDAQIAGATLYREKDPSSLTVSLSAQQGGCLIVKTGVFFFPAEGNQGGGQ
jgi:hypothetical protein